MSPTFLIAIPVFNEARHVHLVLNQTSRYADDIVVIDDGSTDSTPKLLAEQRIAKVIRHQGGRFRYVTKTGTSDMNVVAPVWDCPLAAYGPGDSRLDHTPEERVSLTEYLQSIRVLTSVLDELLGKNSDV